jgi:hypothetical protein
VTRALATPDAAAATAERPALARGDVVRTDLIRALLLAPVATKLGPAWRALVLSGHEAGRETLVFADQVREARPYQDPSDRDEPPTSANA